MYLGQYFTQGATPCDLRSCQHLLQQMRTCKVPQLAFTLLGLIMRMLQVCGGLLPELRHGALPFVGSRPALGLCGHARQLLPLEGLVLLTGTATCQAAVRVALSRLSINIKA